MDRRKIKALLRSSGNYIVSTPSSTVDLKKKEKRSHPRERKRNDEKSTTSLEPVSSNLSDIDNGTSSEYAAMSPDDKTGEIGQGDDLCLPSLIHLRDIPMSWEDVDKPRKTNLYDLLMTRFKNSTNPDIFIKVGKQQFTCHLIVLQCYASYFKTCKFGQVVALPEDEVTAEGFANMYSWMLSSDCVEQLLNRYNALDTFIAAQFLSVSELEEACWAIIDSAIFQEETALLLYMEAKNKKQTAVMDLMLPRISHCFLSLVSLEEYGNIPCDVICTLLRSNYIAVHCEAEVFMSAVKWLMHGWERKKDLVVEIMKCVRFGLMEPWQLVDIPRNALNPEFTKVCNFPEVRAMIEDGLSYAVHRHHYADNRDEYLRWINKLSLKCPDDRNWLEQPRRYERYIEFLQSLEEFRSEYREKSTLHTMWVAPMGKGKHEKLTSEPMRSYYSFNTVPGSKSCN